MFPSNPNNPFQPNQYPRLTNPSGTFLNNPSTAADGIFGGNQPSNIPQIGAQVGTPEAAKQNSFTGGFSDWLKSIFTPKPSSDYSILFGQNAPAPGLSGNPSSVSSYTPPRPLAAPVPTQAFVTPPSSVQNNLVGNDIGSNPNLMSNETLQQMFPGRSAAEIQQFMTAKGYTFQPANKPGLGGGSWVLTNPQTQTAVQAPVTSFGNNFVDPTQLAPGERVQVNPGYNVVGGTPTTKAQGTTPVGTSQYAVTVGTVNKKLDEKGAYKWTSSTVRDSSGNWVKVYKKELRGPYSKGGRQQQEMKQEQRQQQAQQRADVTPAEINQLVNMRVNYG